MQFEVDKGKDIVLVIVKAIQKNRDYLSEVDGLIGDGDHGINMNKGFTMFEDKIKDREEMNLTEAFSLLGRTLLGDIGGSMGPLYGTFFIEMSKQANDMEQIDKNMFAKMLTAALYGIKNIGNAQAGDKTLIDCLEPAANSYIAAISQGCDFVNALVQMKAAAEAGRDSTKDMVAKVGRASRLGERSKGVIDAGAASCCIILCALADAILSAVEIHSQPSAFPGASS